MRRASETKERPAGGAPGSGGRPHGRNGLIRALILCLIALLFGMGLSLNYVYSTPSPGDQLSLDSLGRLADRGQVFSARFLDEDATVVGTYCTVRLVSGDCPTERVRHAEKKYYWTSYLRSDATTADLVNRLSRQALVVVDPQPGKAMLKFVSQFLLPLVILANLFAIIFLAKGSESGISDIVGFGGVGRDRQRRKRTDRTITFADVAGADEAITELREVRDYLRDPSRYRELGAHPPKGVLLFGPPGCGKTLLARAVAGEAGVPFFSISGAEFVESLVGVGAARVRDLFRQVREVAPAIIFIDELDAAARRRGGDAGGGGEREQTLNQMLVEIDGFEVTEGIVVMGATNRPDIIDPALLRPGRFDRHVTLEPPDIQGRVAILQLHARGKPLAPGVDVGLLARATPGFTGADLFNVINEAALLTVRDGERIIGMAQLQEAVQRVLAGPKRRGHLLAPDERERVAHHEAGHAVVTAALGRTGDIQRVSIVARGRGLGQSNASSDADRTVHTRSELEEHMAMAMGGICAEELRFGEPSTAAEDDIEKVTELAHRMIGRYGMSPALGTRRLLPSDADLYLGGGDGAALVHVSEATMGLYDGEVRRLIQAARLRATQSLTGNWTHLQRMVSALLVAETLEGDQLDAHLPGIQPRPHAAAPPPPPPPGNGMAPDAAAPADPDARPAERRIPG